MKIVRYLYIVFLTILLFVNLMRCYISIKSILIFNRIPIFSDGLIYPKAIAISWRIDEKILLFGHFLNPLLLLFCIVLFFYINRFKKRFFSLTILIFFTIFEVGLRFSGFYDYLMFD